MELKLRTKVIYAVVLVILCFGVLETYYVASFSSSTMLEREKVSLESLTREISNELAQVFNNSILLVETIAKQDDLVEYLSSEHKLQDPEMLEMFESYNLGEAYSAIYLMTKEGDTLVSTNTSFVGNNYSFRTYFQKALDEEVAVDVVLGVTSGKLGYYFAKAVHGIDGDILGVIVAKMDPDFIHNILQTAVQDGDIESMLVDSCGVIVYASEEQDIFKSMGTVGPLKSQKITDGKRFEGIDIKAAQYEDIQSNLDNIENVTVYDSYEDGKIVVITKIGKFPFFIVVLEEKEMYLLAARDISQRMSVFVFGTAIVASLILLLVISRFLHPLEDLEKAALKASQGDYDVKIGSLNHEDELGRLADAFNTMLDGVQKSEIEIQKQVKERTKQIEKLNKNMTGRELKMIELKEKIKELENKMKKK